jgi:hypothetical protein
MPSATMRALLLALALLLRVGNVPAQNASDAGKPPPAFDHAVLISVDGLRSDALLAQPPAALPAFARMLAGASTLDARTDPDYTVTLPNHTCMLTGRPVLGTEGHGWVENDDAPEGMTLHKNKGAYVAGIFDVAHDRGVRTAIFAGKTKFSLYDASWSAENGAPDTVGEDQGRKKIDEYVFTEKTAEIADGIIRNLKTGGQRSLVFAHFAVTDLTAHAYGWDLTPGSRYLKALASIDQQLGRVLDAIGADESLRGHTAVVLTADHGGGAPFKSHDQIQMWVDYIIPFLVWTGDGEAKRDLYALNPRTRADPGLAKPRTAAAAKIDGSNGGAGATPGGGATRGAGAASGAESTPGASPAKTSLPPIRNGDAGNLIRALLGLPSVPGSTINAGQDLSVFPEH